MPNLGLQPSLFNGYAKNASESEHPELWPGLIGGWLSSIGNQGNKVSDLSGFNTTGDFLDIPGGSEWVTGRDGFGVNIPDGSGRISFQNDGHLTPENEMTIIISVTPKSVLHNDRMLDSKTVWNAPNGYSMTFLRNPNFIQYVASVVSGGSDYATLSNILWAQDDQFTIGISQKGTGITVFKDGVFTETGTVLNLVSNTNNLFVAHYVPGGSVPGIIFHGLLIFDRALSRSELGILTSDISSPFHLSRERHRFVAAVGGPTFKPAWALGPGSVIGGPVFA